LPDLGPSRQRSQQDLCFSVALGGWDIQCRAGSSREAESWISKPYSVAISYIWVAMDLLPDGQSCVEFSV